MTTTEETLSQPLEPGQIYSIDAAKRCGSPSQTFGQMWDAWRMSLTRFHCNVEYRKKKKEVRHWMPAPINWDALIAKNLTRSKSLTHEKARKQAVSSKEAIFLEADVEKAKAEWPSQKKHEPSTEQSSDTRAATPSANGSSPREKSKKPRRLKLNARNLKASSREFFTGLIMDALALDHKEEAQKHRELIQEESAEWGLPFITETLKGVGVPETAIEHLLAYIESSTGYLFDEVRKDILRLKNQYSGEFAIRRPLVPRELCLTFGVLVPQPGKPINLDAANKRFRTLLANTHPDKFQGETEEIQAQKLNNFQLLRTQFDLLKKYNEALVAFNGKE
jgi:hypothetical protein